MDSTLVPCPACDRHVRVSEATCPFCTAPLPVDLARRAVPAAPRRLGRAAAFTFGLVALGTPSCGARSELPGSGEGGGCEDIGTPVALYGGPIIICHHAGPHSASEGGDAGPSDDDGDTAPPDGGQAPP